MLEQPYYTAYGKTRQILKELTGDDLRVLGERLGINPEVREVPDLLLDIASELITDSPELGKLIPVK